MKRVPAAVLRAATPRPLERAAAGARARVRHWIGGLSLRGRLMLLVVALAMPFLLYMGALAWIQAQSERREAFESAESLAGIVSARVDDFIDDSDFFLRLVAHAAGETTAATMQHYVDNLRADLRPYLGDVALWTLQGAPLAALDPQTLSGPYDIAKHEAFREALRTGALGIEAPVILHAGAEPVVLLARGVADARGQIVGVVTATARLRQLDRILDPSRTLPADAVVTLLDPSGIVVARSRDPEKWIGRDMSATFDRARFERTRGSSEVLGFDGVRRISGYASPTRASWKVYVGIPREAAFMRLKAQVQATILLGGAALLLGLLFAAVAGNGITTRLRALADDAAQLEAGALDHRSRVRAATKSACSARR